jgi:dipeptidyl-peptidase-4
MAFRVRPRLLGISLAGLSVLIGGRLLAEGPGPQVTLDRLAAMAPYQQFLKLQAALQGAPPVVSGAVSVTWAEDGKAFTYARGGKMHRYDLVAMNETETGDAPTATGDVVFGRGGGAGTPPGAGRGGRGRGAAGGLPPGVPNPCPLAQVERGRQAACAPSPDGQMKAYYRDRNLYLSNADGSGEVAITTDGNEKGRIKYGVGSWVYGEELNQTTAIWWSPDGAKVAFYRFDESHVKDYYIQMQQTQIQVGLDVEAYPKAGSDNPIADVIVYDVASKQRTPIDARNGQPFTNDSIGHYVYNVRWSPDGTELFMNRTNRRQQMLDFVACSPANGRCRVVVHEEWKTGWVDNRPGFTYLADNKRFIWESERNGFTNYYLYDLGGKLINPITSNTFEAGSIVRVDETAGVLYYTARDGDNHMKLQLHRVGLNGKGDVRLTDPKFTHAVSLSPDGKFFVDVYQTHDQPPATQVIDATGKVVAQLAKSDLTKFDQLGLKKVEMFSYKAADGQTTLYGTITFPSTFDPSKKYPTLVPVYGGPASGSNVPTESFAMPSAQAASPYMTAEYGFLVVNLMSRSAPGMGRKVLDSIYLKLGQTEMDDMAEGVKALWSRPYFDKGRVGIHGSSYGGYTSVMEILRHPDVFTAASAGSPVTAWYHYDTIYTERYMWIPQENKEGYEAGSAMTYAKNLKGRLLIYYGTADNNVHPNNSMQLIQALQRAGKSFELQVGPDAPHSDVNSQRKMEFFIENLILRPERLLVPGS